MRITGKEGLVNNNGNLCRFPKFGYHYMNDRSRLTKPMLKVKGRFQEISFNKAFDILKEKIGQSKADENAFFAGARLTNEELYLVQKLARAGVGTNNISSFHYMNRGTGYLGNSAVNVPFDEISGASKIYFIGSEINNDNAVAGFMVNDASIKNNIPLELVTTHDESSMEHKVDEVIRIKSYYHFIKAVNYYLVANNFHNQMFIEDNCRDFESYKAEIMKENFVDLVEKSGVQYMDQVIEFAKEYNSQMNAIVIFSEKDISSNASRELFNMAMITGKLGKTSSGLVCLKEKNNSEGVFNMGVCTRIGVGGLPINDKGLIEKMQKKWKIDKLRETTSKAMFDSLESGNLKNLFIFGEDPLGCAFNKVQVAGWLSIADFVVVQDYFMTSTAEYANLILPASMPVEIGGSFTNTQKVIQEFEPVFGSRVGRDSIHQLGALLNKLEVKQGYDRKKILQEALSFLGANGQEKHVFEYTSEDNPFRLFDYGCDDVVRRFEEDFQAKLGR
jgi:predicted molibdopterin-dependent oxidoreductase YjgC